MKTPLFVCIVCLFALVVGCNKDDAGETVEDKKVVVGASSEAPGSASTTPTNTQKPVSAECQIAVSVEGMVCDVGCSPKVLHALEGVEGVAHVTVDYPAKKTEVLGDGSVCSEDGAKHLIDALKAVEYDGKVEAIEPFSS